MLYSNIHFVKKQYHIYSKLEFDSKIFYLLQYLLIQQTPFVRRQVRKVTNLFSCSVTRFVLQQLHITSHKH